MKHQAGFTLVEIAIVLVVIGLLLGGVLKGQELILNSQVRNVVNEFNNVAAAKYTYQDRYRQIPGDDPFADDRWNSGSLTVLPGNGDGVIQGAWDVIDPVEGTTEAGMFWHHLRNDGLVYGPRHGDPADAPTYQLPRNAFDGLIGVQETAFGATTTAMPGPVICQSRVPGKAAAIIDTRIDDDPGDGTGGTTGILQGAAGEDPSNAEDAAAYVLDDTPFIICREM